jgi:DNA-binding transcriptional ArsR family regulator
MDTRTNTRRAVIAGVLASPIRLAILAKLSGGPRLAGELVEAVGAQQAAVSKQLGVLWASGLVSCRPEGRCRLYALAAPQAPARLWLAGGEAAGRAERGSGTRSGAAGPGKGR